jgi:flagellar M-ring protein FliF
VQQLIAIWQALDTRRRVIAIGATVATFAAVLLLAGQATKPSMSLLYAGLEGGRAGDVVTALDQRGAIYEVRGDAIYVEATKRDALRMTLAADGLPQNSSVGYELLDSLSGFGTTSQMFDAAYWRAKEGELARTIAASGQVRSARVHIANPRSRGFGEPAHPTASVTVTMAGGGLSPAQAKALQYLVASAVAGARPEDVSVIDSAAGLVVSGNDAQSAAAGDDRAAELKHNVERLLEARVGYGNAVVEVSVDTVTESEAITERRFDPQNRVAISTDTQESSNSANDTKPGSVTVASNLPQGDAGAAGGQSQSQKSETRERVNFEVSETKREVVRAPGDIRRLTVAVLVDGIQTASDTGEPVFSPRPDDELAALRELVESAVGFNAERGDVITLKSMALEQLGVDGTAPPTSVLDRFGVDVMSLLQLAVLAIVSLVLGLFVLRPILKQPSARLPELAPPLKGAAQSSALDGEIDEGDFQPGPMAVVGGLNPAGSLPALASGGMQDAEPDDPVSRLRRLIDERQDETVEVLRSWMDGPKEEKA